MKSIISTEINNLSDPIKSNKQTQKSMSNKNYPTQGGLSESHRGTEFRIVVEFNCCHTGRLKWIVTKKVENRIVDLPNIGVWTLRLNVELPRVTYPDSPPNVGMVAHIQTTSSQLRLQSTSDRHTISPLGGSTPALMKHYLWFSWDTIFWFPYPYKRPFLGQCIID